LGVMDLAFMLDTMRRIASGVPLTLQLAALSIAAGIAFAMLLALMRVSALKPLDLAARGYVFVFRGTPLLVQIFLIYYGMGQFETIRESMLWPVLREPYWCAIIALTLNSAAYTGEIIRGGIQAVPFGQVEAAKACGMSTAQTYRRIVLPQAFRLALPAYGNEIILMVQASALASTITIMELTGAARAIASRTFQPVEVFVIAGAIYLALNFLISRGVRVAELRLNPARR
ncbi:MAG TPA: ABC transporter permease, partial [Azospirillaceae bacterium]|nr:ABC transporter permease [Azospirillaceae bacterium]